MKKNKFIFDLVLIICFLFDFINFYAILTSGGKLKFYLDIIFWIFHILFLLGVYIYIKILEERKENSIRDLKNVYSLLEEIMKDSKTTVKE